MSVVTTIWMHQSFTKPDQMKIQVMVASGATDTIDVPLPPDFKQVVLNIAQAAADLYEQNLLAKLLVENRNNATPSL